MFGFLTRLVLKQCLLAVFSFLKATLVKGLGSVLGEEVVGRMKSSSGPWAFLKLDGH